mmetsp:Transcript_2734/g.4899  ORF Transcript_2734/g.4899 Transcript_2734/m.4899 type:complete len:228 (-) Transcript_2734:72-755(-)
MFDGLHIICHVNNQCRSRRKHRHTSVFKLPLTHHSNHNGVLYVACMFLQRYGDTGCRYVPMAMLQAVGHTERYHPLGAPQNKWGPAEKLLLTCSWANAHHESPSQSITVTPLGRVHPRVSPAPVVAMQSFELSTQRHGTAQLWPGSGHVIGPIGGRSTGRAAGRGTTGIDPQHLFLRCSPGILPVVHSEAAAWIGAGTDTLSLRPPLLPLARLSHPPPPPPLLPSLL